MAKFTRILESNPEKYAELSGAVGESNWQRQALKVNVALRAVDKPLFLFKARRHIPFQKGRVGGTFSYIKGMAVS